jgi:hypothetical protein
VNPEIVVHLESGDNVVILEGVVEEVADYALRKRSAQTYTEKYQFEYSVNPVAGGTQRVIYALHPRVAFTWLEKDFLQSPTRWHFGEEYSPSILFPNG